MFHLLARSRNWALLAAHGAAAGGLQARGREGLKTSLFVFVCVCVCFCFRGEGGGAMHSESLVCSLEQEEKQCVNEEGCNIDPKCPSYGGGTFL